MKTIHPSHPVCELQASPDLQEAAFIDLRSGNLCPACGKGRLDYNGSIELECPECGFTLGDGGCT
jgi:uncharacterized protein (DUF983 family)